MTTRKLYARLTTLLVSTLLLLGAAPSAPAQRRRTAPPRPANPQRPATTPRAPSPAAPLPRAEPQPSPAAPAAQQQEEDLPAEDILAEDSYGVYGEIRRIGQIVEGEDVKMALGALRLLGDAADKTLADLAGFVTEHSEALSEARVSVGFMATRAQLPPTLVALQMPSAQSAAAFEPKLRAFLKGVVPPKAPAAAAEGTRQRGARKPSKPKAVAPGFVLKRAGSLLLMADGPFTLKTLRPEGANPLSQSVRFQAARNRFSSEQLFVYFDTTHVQQGWAVQTQREQEERERQQAALGGGPSDQYDVRVSSGAGIGSATDSPAGEVPRARSVGVAIGPPPAAGTAEPTLTTDETAEQEIAVIAPKIEGSPEGEPPEITVEVYKPTEEEMAAGQMLGVMRHLWGGIPRIPGAVAAAVGLDGGSIAIRVAVDIPPEGAINVIPFLPNVVSGPPVTSETAAVAPADADIFLNFSLDWTQIFNSMMGTAASTEVLAGAGVSVPTAADVIVGGGGARSSDDDRGGGEKPRTAEETVAAVEKVFGFKFKEDLLPALGNEVAVSLPSKLFTEPFRINRRSSAKKEEEKDSEPGVVVLVALNDPEKVRKIFPRVLAALSFFPSGAPSASERREGFDIQAAGGFTYVFIDNYLVIGGDIKSVRHAVDSYARRDTLAATNAYRDATAWQANQRLLHAYLSDALMSRAIADTKKMASASTDPLVQTMLAQLELPPEAASYSATNEGDALLHELRLPVNLVKVYAAASIIGAKESPVISNEMMAVLALSRLRDAEDSYRGSEGRQRYGTLEELIAEELIEKGFGQHVEYKIELTPVGDRYEVVATPKNYGKTGRRSFFLDESGIIRGADHKGQPAKADDPPVD